MRQTKTKKPILRPGDRSTRRTMREAHDAGRHGPEDAPEEIVLDWASMCADCYWRWHYDFGPGKGLFPSAVLLST